MLWGCAAETAGEPEPSPSAPVSETVVPEADKGLYKAYEDAIRASHMDSYTAAVQRRYDVQYEDGTKSVYDLDGVIEDDGENIHVVQHINADGIQSEVEGWYDGSRLYMTYNTVEYYEEMDADSVRMIMLVPLKPYAVPEEAVESIAVNETEQGSEYAITLKPASAKSVFDNRYDIYGLNQYDPYEMKQGIITQTFDKTGALVSEKTSFESSITANGIGVDITSETSAEYLNVNSTSVLISDSQKKKFAGYVSFMEINTDAISDADITSDLPEDDPIDTLKKRLVNRLNYTVQEDGTYLAEFNEGESYRFDFSNSLFTYSNRTSHYVYNWKGDQGGFGDTCSIDFTRNQYTDGCEESVVNTMRDVKNYFLMELYYCGLSLDDLK